MLHDRGLRRGGAAEGPFPLSSPLPLLARWPDTFPVDRQLELDELTHTGVFRGLDSMCAPGAACSVSGFTTQPGSLSDPVTYELFLLLKKCPIDGKQIWPRWKTNFNQVLDLDDPSPTQLHPTQKSYQPLYHQARYTQSLGGQLPIPELVSNTAVGGMGVVSKGGLGGFP